MTSSMPSSAATRSAVASAVAGEHDRPDAELAERADGRGGGLARGVGDGDDGRGLAVDGDLHARAALTGQLVRAGGQAVTGDAFALQQAGVADGEPMAVDGGEQSVAGDGLEGLGARHLQAARGCGLDDRLGERVLAVALGGGDQAQHLVLVDAVGGRDLDDLGLAARERAGLVEHHRVQRRRLLQRQRVLEQDAAPGAEARADHDRPSGSPARARPGR